jgi:hypothetical protein
MDHLKFTIATACTIVFTGVGSGAHGAPACQAAGNAIDSACVAHSLLRLPEKSRWDLVLVDGTKQSGQFVTVNSSGISLSLKTKLAASPTGWPEPPRDTVATIPFASIEQAGYHAPHQKSGAGILIGGVAGAVLGAAIGRGLDEPCVRQPDDFFDECIDFHEEVVLMTLVGALVGAVVGSSLDPDTAYEPLHCPGGEAGMTRHPGP